MYFYVYMGQVPGIKLMMMMMMMMTARNNQWSILSLTEYCSDNSNAAEHRT